MNSRCADCNYEDCRCDRPPMPAAGPWRTDVENAPKDGSEIAAEFNVLGAIERHFVKWHSGSGSWESPSEKLPDDALRAFATINRPETTHDNP